MAPGLAVVNLRHRRASVLWLQHRRFSLFEYGIVSLATRHGALDTFGWGYGNRASSGVFLDGG